MTKNHRSYHDRMVSVIIPTFNSSTTIKTCLEAIHNQSYKNYEIIVADNYSSDSTIDIAKHLKASVILHSGKPCNPASAKNTGFIHSSGDYILFLDSDEILEKDVLKECVKICERGKVRMIKIPIFFIGKTFWGKCSAFWRNCHYAAHKRATASNVPRFFIKKLLPSAPFDENLIHGEDWELYRRMKSMSVKEQYSISPIFHQEPVSMREIALKNLYYAKIAPLVSEHVAEKTYFHTIKYAILTLKEALENLPRSPLLFFGCLIILCVKAFTVSVVFLDNLFPK